MHVLIVGAGLGGLSCAIGCRRKGLEVTILERDERLTEVFVTIMISRQVLTFAGSTEQVSNYHQTLPASWTATVCSPDW
jgi:2-polyprenyl-6-methoxyphenol hydroxylase-like FAD-dependent oxidoreductase